MRTGQDALQSGRAGHERGGRYPGMFSRSYRLVHRRALAGRCDGGMDESSIKSKNIPTIFLQITGEWPGLSFVFRKSGINTNEIYG